MSTALTTYISMWSSHRVRDLHKELMLANLQHESKNLVLIPLLTSSVTLKHVSLNLSSSVATEKNRQKEELCT